MIRTLANIAAAALDPSRMRVMAGKVVNRFERKGTLTHEQNVSWLRSNLRAFPAEAERLDKSLWQETLEFQGQLDLRAKRVLPENIELGGGGYYALLYFITRRRQPECVVETGVAAGYSSQAFLSAMAKNGSGHLYSSDFPYFRLSKPEQYIGVLVEERLRDRWDLFIKGDRANLPEIMSRVTKVDVFHFDSDKSYSGRTFAMSQVLPKMAADGVVIMDDIQDNAHFFDYVRERNPRSFSVYEFWGKYVGLIGEL